MLGVIYLIIAGAIGGFINAIFEGDFKVALPYIEGKYVYMGGIGSVVVGAVVGFYVGTDIKTALGAGIASPLVLEGIVEKIRKT